MNNPRKQNFYTEVKMKFDSKVIINKYSAVRGVNDLSQVKYQDTQVRLGNL